MDIESIGSERLAERAALHAALGDAYRLGIVDELMLSDRAPSELGSILGIDSNLLAHHLAVLENLNLVERVTSQGDRRRRYVKLVPTTIASLGIGGVVRVGRVVFVCTENAARSQLAAALWNYRKVGVAAVSGGTAPAKKVHPGTIRAVSRRGLTLQGARPAPIPEVKPTDLVVTVCDKAHEMLSTRGTPAHIHWSVSDPLVSGDQRAFDQALEVLDRRVERLSTLVSPSDGSPGQRT